MHVWRKFFAGLSILAEVVFPPALALFLMAKAQAFLSSSAVFKLVTPYWEKAILDGAKTAADFISPYVLAAGLISLFCFIVGPENFTRRARTLWNAIWIFFIFNIGFFLLGIADPSKLSVWSELANLAFGIIALSQKIFGFSVYVGWAAGIAFIYSLVIIIKDLIEAFMNFGVGLLDRRVKPILIDELKNALSLRMIRTAGDLIPITPSLLILMLAIFIVGAFPLFLVQRLSESGLTPVLNVLGAAILTYGFVQIFGVIFIFLTGLVYYLTKKNRLPAPPPRFQI